MARPRTGPYCWPLKPFHRMHPVRGYFNDPRISGRSRAFHFGIDIAGRDGQPVFAVEGGIVHKERTRSIAVVSDGGARSFAYWHILPAVKHGQRVRQHQLVGYIEEPWAHVHFAERRRGEYRNPLRPGALVPWVDPSSPRISRISFERGGKEVSPLDVKGLVDVIVEAFDLPPVRVPAPWSNLPVTPALLRWRVLRGRQVVRAWHAPVDFRRTMLPASLFNLVYAPGTRQNKAGKPGRYRFFVAHTWDTRRLRNGLYRIEVSAADVHGNRAVAALPFTVANRR